MTKEQMIEIKADINRLKKLIDQLAIVWPDDKMTIITVLLQNIGFGGPDSPGVNYSFDTDVEKMNNCRTALREMAEYRGSEDYLSRWVSNEVEDIFFMALVPAEIDREYHELDPGD